MRRMSAVLLAAAAIGFGGLRAEAQTPSIWTDIMSKKKLTVCIVPSYQPYSWKDPKGEWQVVQPGSTLGFGRPQERTSGDHAFTIDSLIGRARSGDGKAAAALQTSARYLGLGLGGIVNIIDPDCIFIGGEITTAWDLIESSVRSALRERALSPAAASTDIVIVSAEEHPRLRGAAMLVAAPTFAAPVVA